MDPRSARTGLDGARPTALRVARYVAATAPRFDGPRPAAMCIASDVATAGATLDRADTATLGISFDDGAGAAELPAAGPSSLRVALDVSVVARFNAAGPSSLRVTVLPLAAGFEPLRRGGQGGARQRGQENYKQQDDAAHGDWPLVPARLNDRPLRL